MPTPLDYARRGLKRPRPTDPTDRRGPLERKLDRIGLIVVIVILATFWGGIILLFALVALSGHT